ncbi:MAG TPA: hypothetical protein VE690_09235, partial [Rhodopila sp.]|nr:hypothetical protein [Rhodopila sp.]
AQAARRSFRRLAGAALLYLVEILILAVLLVAAMRAAVDFWNGTYAPAGLFATVLMLIAILLVIGQTVGGVFFPPLRRRFRQLAGKRARALVQAALDKAETVLRTHIEAVDRLSREGHELLRQIDRTTMQLAAEGASSPAIDRLFAEEVPEPASLPPPATQRRPAFD